MNPTEGSASGDLAGLRFNVTDLRRSPGSRSSERRVVRPVGLDDSRSHAIGEVVVASVPVTVDVDMESLKDGVRVRATVDYGWEGVCRRCLGAARGTITSEIVELFVDEPEAYEGSGRHPVAGGGVYEVSGGGEADREARRLASGWVDLSESVRDALLLGLPLAPLCAADCSGPSPEKYPVEVKTDDLTTAPVPSGDPRWAVLDDIRFDPEGT